jgi:hypothetical protein
MLGRFTVAAERHRAPTAKILRMLKILGRQKFIVNVTFVARVEEF